ncbi:unnamed protein product [Chondrus crispus]|uniref:Uncharacterized protein n=1 Tax=Chondrus crispus TaxID=2769 RepID=R7QEI3_CHOCR|nr:unnamed protein product [Chondrus crispus]CDF35840.1 unnamed protein product [Chondrus crispus]|eukprot:XP_005715659.1 unnamed protein product [Chondrus crispus]
MLVLHTIRTHWSSSRRRARAGCWAAEDLFQGEQRQT